jgi:hypothetical protein
VAATTRDLAPFYRSALLAIHALEATGARRPSFGTEADARWRAFQGELRDADRVDLILRNAAATIPAAFAPRVILGIEGLAEDEPFGPDWPGADAVLARSLLEAATRPADPAPLAVLGEVARAWGLMPGAVDRATLAGVAPQTRLVAAGAGAIVALAERFRAGAGLDLAEQVLLVTANPGERQLMGIAAALLGSARAPRFAAPGAVDVSAIRAAGFPFANQLVVSSDADPAVRQGAEALARELGA